MKPLSRSAVLLTAALCCLLWSGAYVTAKIAIGTPGAPGFGRFTACFFRFALAGVLLFAWGRWRDPDSMRVRREDWPAFGRLALLGLCLTYVFNYAGLDLSSGTAAGLIMATAPVFVVLVAVVFLKEKLTARKAFGCAAGLAGALLVVTSTQNPGATPAAAKTALLGNALIALSLAWESGAVLTVKHLTRRYKGRAVVTYEFLLGSLMLLPFAAWETLQRGGLPHPTLAAWGSFAYLVVGCTLVGYTLWFRLMETADVSEITVFIFLQPVVGTILGVVVERAPLTPMTGVGALLVFAGVAGLTLRLPHAKPRRIDDEGGKVFGRQGIRARGDGGSRGVLATNPVTKHPPFCGRRTLAGYDQRNQVYGAAKRPPGPGKALAGNDVRIGYRRSEEITTVPQGAVPRPRSARRGAHRSDGAPSVAGERPGGRRRLGGPHRPRHRPG